MGEAPRRPLTLGPSPPVGERGSGTRELLQRIRRIEIATKRAVQDRLQGSYHSVFKGRGMSFDEVKAVLGTGTYGRVFLAFDPVMLAPLNILAGLDKPSAGAAVVATHNLLAMGSHGRGAFKSLVLGSVAMRVAARCELPLLIIHGRLDRLIPWQQAHKIVDTVGPNAELAMFENGNHVCNNIPYIYRPLTADWLKEKLG